MNKVFDVKSLPKNANYLAPDKSEIRKLLEFDEGNICHCRLPAGQMSQAVKHKTVEELWYCISGQRKMWQERPDGTGCVQNIKEGDSLSIPLGNFQFENTGNDVLEFLICTMPKWPEDREEAISVDALHTKGFENCEYGDGFALLDGARLRYWPCVSFCVFVHYVISFLTKFL